MKQIESFSMIKQITTLAALALAGSFAAGQSASVSLSATSMDVAPGGTVSVSLLTSFDTAGAGGGIFGNAGFYGFGGTIAATGDAAANVSASAPALNNMLNFGPVSFGGSAPAIATGAAGRGFDGGIAGDPGALMTFDITVDAGAMAGTSVTLDFSGAVVLVLDSTLTTFSTDPGANQQSLGSQSITLNIGAGGCSAADLSMPFGILDLSDINTFVSGFLANDAISDIDGSGVFDLTDINLFVGAFIAGCP